MQHADYTPVLESSRYYAGWMQKHGMDPAAIYAQAKDIEYVPREQLTVKIYRRESQLARSKQFYADQTDDKYPHYRYTGSDKNPKPKYYPHWLREIRDAALAVAIETQPDIHDRITLNHCVVNYYMDGNDHIGYHSDKTDSLAKDTPIITVSVGRPRRMLLKHGVDDAVKIVLEPGSLFLLSAADNKKYKHSIPRTKKLITEGEDCGRISFTFRSVADMRDK
jgi:alkylated DNA repair dioxygenase AlkB